MIETISETGSTNADLAARLAAGQFVAEGQWLVADRQSAGRGRQGRVWQDGLGNFMGSTLVHLRPGDPAPGTLALIAGLAVLEAVAPLVAPPHRVLLKWPNDLLIDGAKLAGILLERIGDAVIVGIGVNLAQAPNLPDRATFALSAFGPALDRDVFAGNLAGAFAEELHRWRSYGLAPVISRWQAAGFAKGTPIFVQNGPTGPLSGTFDGLCDDGALRLVLGDGTACVIHAGEVNLA